MGDSDAFGEALAGFHVALQEGDAQRALLGVDLSLIQTKADELTTLVGLYQAVGGAPG